MLALKLFCHVPLRGKLTYLLVFLLCLYCSPSVLFMALCFGVIACITEQRAVSELCWMVSVFFLLWWFHPLASLFPVCVYLAAECWHTRLDRLARQANSTGYFVNPRSGGNVYSTVNNFHSCSLVGTSAAVNNSFSSLTSGFAMFNNNSVVARDTTRGLYNRSVGQHSNHIWVSHPFASLNDQSLTSASGDPTSFDSSFRNLITLVKSGLFYIGTSSQVNALVSGLETLSVSASSLAHAPLVRAPPNDDSFYDGSGDRSSLAACRCGGTGYTSRGSCSCLGHVCSGNRCGCLYRGKDARGPYFSGIDDRSSHRLSGLPRLGIDSCRWFLHVMVHLQDQFSRLALGSGDDIPATEAVLHGDKSTCDDHNVNHWDTISQSNAGLKSKAHSDMLISEELSAMATTCLSVTDNIVRGKDNGGDVEISHSTFARDNGGHACYSGSSKMFSRSSTMGNLSMNSVNNGVSSFSCNSVDGDIHNIDGVDGSDVVISRRDQETFNDIDSGSIASHTSYNSDRSAGDERLMNAAIDNNGSQGNSVDAELQSESGSLQSWKIYDSDHSVVNSPLYAPAFDDYEESYNPFGSDDDGSSTGTAPLYSGTAVFNDESAFGTF